MARRTNTTGLSELRGSRPWTEAEARRVLDAWGTSGETIAVFARRVGLVPQRVYWWRDRLAPASTLAPSFLPVVVRAEPETARVAAGAVTSRGGHRIEVASLDASSARWVAALVKALEEVAS